MPRRGLQVDGLEGRSEHLLCHVLRTLSALDDWRVELKCHPELRGDEFHLLMDMQDIRKDVGRGDGPAHESVEQEGGVSERLVDGGRQFPSLEGGRCNLVLDHELGLRSAELPDERLDARENITRHDLLDGNLSDLPRLHPEASLCPAELLHHFEGLGVDMDRGAVLLGLCFGRIVHDAHRVPQHVNLGNEVLRGLVDVRRGDLVPTLRLGAEGHREGQSCDRECNRGRGTGFGNVHRCSPDVVTFVAWWMNPSSSNIARCPCRVMAYA